MTAPPLRVAFSLHALPWLLVGGLAYYGGARLGMALLSIQPANITLLWLPSGVALVLCATFGRAALPVIFLASFIANLPGMTQGSLGDGVLHTAIAAAIDTLAGALSAAMLARHLPSGLASLPDLPVFFWRVGVLPILLCAGLLTLNLVAGGYIPPGAGLDYVGMLLFADTLGILLVYPAFAAWCRQWRLSMRQLRPWLLSTACAVALALLAFHELHGLIFLIPPVLVYLASYVREHASPLSLALILCLVALLAAGMPSGPFSAQTPAQARLMLQAFMLSTALLTLGMAYHHRDLLRSNAAAKCDALTGLFNRRVLMPRIERAIAHTRQGGAGFAVAVLDLDHFKRINDTHGHAGGDIVLVAVARHLQRYLRRDDIAARIGGEEFALLLADTSAAEALRTVERLRTDLAASDIQIHDRSVRISLSAGLIHSSETGSTANAEALLDHADRRLYAAKQAGRNCTRASDD